MLLTFLTTLLLIAGAQSPTPDRQHAEDAAREGRNAEALAIYSRLVEINPNDDDARFWIGMMDLRLGRLPEAEQAFRAVVEHRPENVDAQIGLGMSMNRQGRWQEALAIYNQLEPTNGNNGDLLAAMARAYRRGGDFDRTYQYFERARALAPDNWDTQWGFETATRAYSHYVAVEGFGEWGPPGTNVGAERVAGDLRLSRKLHLQGGLRMQQGKGYSDLLGGGGVVWRFAPASNLTLQAVLGSENATLPNQDLSADVVHYIGSFEVGGSVRQLGFGGADVLALSPIISWETDRLRLDTRYTYSHSSFHETGQSSGDNSGLVRSTMRFWRRTALQAGYAYGIESFENLTADRVGFLGSSTILAGVRINTPSLTRITATWEHQWRSNDTQLNRVTVSFVQYIRGADLPALAK